ASAAGRVHALWTLKGSGALDNRLVSQALSDSNQGVLENAIALADPQIHRKQLLTMVDPVSLRLSYLVILRLGDLEQSDPAWIDSYLALLKAGGAEDSWIRKAMLSARDPLTASLVVGLLESGQTGQYADLLEEFTAEVAARGDWSGLNHILQSLDSGDPGLPEISVVAGLSEGLPHGQHAWKTIAVLTEGPNSPLQSSSLAVIHSVVDAAVAIASNSTKDDFERLAVIPLVEERSMTEVFGVAKILMDQSAGPELQSAAVRMLSGFNNMRTTEFFLEHWHAMGLTARQEAIEVMASKENSAMLLMNRMKAGEINPALMPPFRRWWLTRRRAPETMDLAQELFGKADDDRSSLISKYKTTLQEYSGSAERGKEVFSKAACITCHRFNEEGADVGPTLADIRFKPTEALLTDILDPNRAVEGRWALYQVETKDGSTLTGIIANESSSTIELRLPGGHSEKISRSQLKSMETEGISLMPVGLENTVSPAEMADLIAYLTSS
ncbi:MAG: c-type cytochrome, partial [Verrucomicrobiae bacterium]|nr:c-type cytochrome [Verrucomicrobiae bacterium]